MIIKMLGHQLGLFAFELCDAEFDVELCDDALEENRAVIDMVHSNMLENIIDLVDIDDAQENAQIIINKMIDETKAEREANRKEIDL